MARKLALLTVRDLLLAETNGYGYLAHTVRNPSYWANQGTEEPYMAVRMLDEAVVREAIRLGWTADQLQAFVDSKAGRYLGDVVSSAKTIFRAVSAVASFMADARNLQF